MPSLLPSNRPQMTTKAAFDVAYACLDRFEAKHGVDAGAIRKLGVLSLAIRGYYRDTMGTPGQNDFRIFDDAVIVLDFNKGTSKAWNWNTDPNYTSYNPSVGKPYAILSPGLWMFMTGLHRGKGKAWRQMDVDDANRRNLGRFFSDLPGAPVCRRNGNFAVYRGQIGKGLEWGYQAINQHWGTGSTSSFGCQTCPGSTTGGQWLEYQRYTYGLANEGLLPYLLHSDDDDKIF